MQNILSMKYRFMSFKQLSEQTTLGRRGDEKINRLLNRNFISVAQITPLSTSVKDSYGLVACAENQ